MGVLILILIVIAAVMLFWGGAVKGVFRGTFGYLAALPILVLFLIFGFQHFIFGMRHLEENFPYVFATIVILVILSVPALVAVYIVRRRKARRDE